ncbi:hypothetical protein HMPREF3203_00745 [Proteus mirabilis]|nr:hypothetical protein HMPREF3203_00745 [Proteus mirabilis]
MVTRCADENPNINGCGCRQIFLIHIKLLPADEIYSATTERSDAKRIC